MMKIIATLTMMTAVPTFLVMTGLVLEYQMQKVHLKRDYQALLLPNMYQEKM